MRDSESLRLGSNPSPGARPLRFFVLLACTFLPCITRAAETPWQGNPQGQVQLISADNVVSSSGTLWLGLHFKPTTGWYLYWKDAGEAGIPPKVGWEGSTGFKNPELLWPRPTHIILPGDITEFVYEGETVYPVRAQLTGGPVKVRVVLSYLTCMTSCIPYKYTFTLDIPSGPQAMTDPTNEALLQTALALVPSPSETDEQIKSSAVTVHRNPGVPEEPTGVPSGLPWILLLAFVGGLILNVMPCVLPILSIKLFGLLQHGGQSRRIVTRDSLASAAGILFSFLGLALAAILAKQAGHAVGWGIQFQEPVFVAFLMGVVILFALNLWGLFEIPLPAVISRLGSVGSEDEGLGSYFISGLFATLLATPCSAPFLGTAMGFALAQEPIIIIAIFLAVGTGMAFPYLALAVFPGTLRWLPRPGPWMLRVRWVLGSLLMATALWLGSVLLSELRPTSQHTSQLMGETLNWIPFNEAAIQGRLDKGESVFVDVTADWCFTCKVNERLVLNSSGVRLRCPLEPARNGSYAGGLDHPRCHDWRLPEKIWPRRHTFLCALSPGPVPRSSLRIPYQSQGFRRPEELDNEVSAPAGQIWQSLMTRLSAASSPLSIQSGTPTPRRQLPAIARPRYWDALASISLSRSRCPTGYWGRAFR